MEILATLLIAATLSASEGDPSPYAGEQDRQALLSEHQARRYDQLRGYHGSGDSHHH